MRGGFGVWAVVVVAVKVVVVGGVAGAVDRTPESGRERDWESTRSDYASASATVGAGNSVAVSGN